MEFTLVFTLRSNRVLKFRNLSKCSLGVLLDWLGSDCIEPLEFTNGSSCITVHKSDIISYLISEEGLALNLLENRRRGFIC